MEVRIADTCTASLTSLTADEQKQTKTIVLGVQVNPESPGPRTHRIEKNEDKNFWSTRISRVSRLSLHRPASSAMFYYVNRHDRAYYGEH